MRIAICDDIISVCSELEKMITLYSRSVNEAFTIEVYYTGEKLCDDLCQGVCFDMFFLDIELPDVNGISISSCIRKEIRNYEAAIVYVSSHEEYAMELFRFKPFDFLRKPLTQEAVNRVMEEYMDISAGNRGIFQYGEGKNAVAAYIKDILYFTINRRLIEMHTISKPVFFYGKLKDVAEKLDAHCFFYANKSQLVNCNRIKDWGYHTLVMENGEKIFISQGRQKKVAEIHKEYINEKM